MEVAQTQIYYPKAAVARKNGVILTQKVESLEELKFDPRFREIGEYLSQIDSIIRVNFKLTLNIESKRQFEIDSQYRVNI